MRRAAIGAALLGALLAAAPAAAHVIAEPAYVTANEVGTISLDVPNERDQPMIGLVVGVPPEVEIVHAHGPTIWQSTFTAATAKWTGAALAPGATQRFAVVLEAKTEPGTVQLRAEQLYRDGGVVRWPVSLTVLPSKNDPSQNLQLAAVLGLIGLLVLVAIGVLFWRRQNADSSPVG